MCTVLAYHRAETPHTTLAGMNVNPARSVVVIITGISINGGKHIVKKEPPMKAKLHDRCFEEVSIHHAP